MSGEDDTDKQHEPSQKKLDDARAKGDIPRSADLTTAAGYGGFVLAALAFGPASLASLGTAMSVLLGQADRLATDVFAGGGAPLTGGILLAIGTAMLPWFGLPAALALLTVIAQRGLIFSPSKLAPKGSRISPLDVAKNKFGRSGLFEFAKSAVKLTIYSVILGLYLAAQMDRIVATLHLEAAQVASELARLTMGLLFMVLLVALTLGVVDMVWQQAEHTRKNRMSRQELVDEMKQSEGDPALKQQRRQKGISLAMNQMLADVPTADVIIVNPTHYAVALKWDRKAGQAPVCVAKGVDEVAARIREIANENAVPIHADPPTARALHASVEIGQEISPDDYRAVATAIRFAEAIRKKARRW